ncbi:MAG: hypothetical protein U5R30_14225 [Deltaproteobacteria bacterium]|nr:hypothetical protein [Deltaproteobacteria bacterium]
MITKLHHWWIEIRSSFWFLPSAIVLGAVVLGVFVGIFAYCLVVLRTIRGGDQGGGVPTLAVPVG